jgi:hypothetical protein
MQFVRVSSNAGTSSQAWSAVVQLSARAVRPSAASALSLRLHRCFKYTELSGSAAIGLSIATPNHSRQRDGFAAPALKR